MNKIFSLEKLFYLTVLATPAYMLRFTVFTIPTNGLEILVVLSLIALFLKRGELTLAQLKQLPKLLLISVLLILLGTLLSIFFSHDYRTGFGILKSWFILPIAFAFALFTLTNSQKKLEAVLFCIFMSALFVSIISLFYKALGFITYDNRLRAFYLSPNYLAMFLAPGLIFGSYFLLKAYKNKAKIDFALGLLACSLITLSLYFTYSYAAWFAIFCALLLTSFLLGAKLWPILVAGFILSLSAILLQLGSPKFLALWHFSSRSSLASRLMIWDAALLMLKQHPIAGIGPGNFQAAYLALQSYFPPYLEWAVPQPHNLILAFWLQSGLIGLIGFLCLCSYLTYLLWHNLRQQKSALAAPLFAFILYFFIHGLLDTPYWKNDLAFLFWITVSLVFSLSAILTKELRAQSSNENAPQ